MPTPPDVVRAGLVVVTGAAQADLRAISRATSDPAEWRAAMFAAAPLVVSEYSPAAAALSLDWFEEIRSEAAVSGGFSPTPRLNVTDEDVAAMVANVTESLRDIERQVAEQIEQMLADLTAQLELAVQKEVAAGFWDTVTENAAEDPDAVGWQRYAQGAACKFCVMLAHRGAVFTESTVRFAAHDGCSCLAGPSYDPAAPKASAMQYTASKRTRTEKERADLRAYLNHNFPDAPG
jgi:hypothetical protein